MNRIARLLGLSAVLLTIFLVAVLASGLRLRTQTEQVRLKTIDLRRQQLETILAISPPGPLPWADGYREKLEKLLEARITLHPATRPAEEASSRARPTPSTGPSWSFTHPVRDPSGPVLATMDIQLYAPPVIRILGIYQHSALVLLVLALGLLFALILVLIFSGSERTASEPRETNPGVAEPGQGNFGSLSHLAKVSVQQSVDLKHERNERLRAEEDSHFRQVLLNRALEERIQLGRELHDGIIQSLYATGLTLEAAKNRIANDPTGATAQLGNGLRALNATIREVRGYISGLAPNRIQQQTFAEAVHSLAQTLDAGRQVDFNLRIDEAAAAQLSDEQATNLLQIAREAISNGLRHGAASQVTVRLHENAGALCLLVQDNGKGFDPDRHAGSGHGLDNITARAERINATVRIDSKPGNGTRIVLTIPTASPQP